MFIIFKSVVKHSKSSCLPSESTFIRLIKHHIKLNTKNFKKYFQKRLKKDSFYNFALYNTMKTN